MFQKSGFRIVLDLGDANDAIVQFGPAIHSHNLDQGVIPSYI
jgi:hypothetical protein